MLPTYESCISKGDIVAFGRPFFNFQQLLGRFRNLALDPTKAFESLASQLTGASVSVSFGQSTVCGQLMGLQDQQTANDTEPVKHRYLIVMADRAIKRIPIRDETSLQFTDATIQAEIDKVLSRQLRQIKPNSTFVDLTVSSQSESTEAAVQYTVPAAAWKICYRILLVEEGGFELQGHAVVDNNTDEDWRDFIVSVVMGQPITFSSDLADSKSPRREHLNIVPGATAGAVELKPHFQVEELNTQMSLVAEPSGTAGSKLAAKKNKTRTHLFYEVQAGQGPAEVRQAEIAEVGDFCVFQSEYPVSVDARRSAVIPVFQTRLENSKIVLHYNVSNHYERPFRSLEFSNETGHALGRGVCTILENSLYSGSCVVPAMSSGEERLLPYAVDSKVRIHQKMHEMKSKRIGVQISDGVVVNSYDKTQQTDYQVTSNSESKERLFIDHDSFMSESKSVVQLLRTNADPQDLEFKELPGGFRAELELQPKDELIVRVVETKTESNQLRLTGNSPTESCHVDFLRKSLVEFDGSLIDDQQFEAALTCNASSTRYSVY